MATDWIYITVHPDTKVKIDRADKERVTAKSWRVTLGASGRPRIVTSYREDGKIKTMTLGKFLMKPPKNKQVYPRRFVEGFDYRRENLIVCTVKERQRLLPKHRKKATSVFRGVSFSSKIKKWRAGIEVNGKSINLGQFKKEEDAALAYNKAAEKHFGKMAYQNDISRAKKRRVDAKS